MAQAFCSRWMLFFHCVVLASTLSPSTFKGSAAVVAVHSSTNLTSCYDFLKFDPLGKNCGVLVQISDIQICFANTGPLTTNLDERMVRMVNSIKPRPQVLAFSGDLCNSLGPSPGFGSVLPAGLNELIAARAELKRLTNCETLYAVPGNHDCITRDYTGKFWTNVTQFTRYTNFWVAGLPVLMLDSQFQGYIDSEQADWLFKFRSKLDRTKPVLIMQHLPIMAIGASFGREAQYTILRFLDGWSGNVWMAVGHTHGRYYATFPYGSAKIHQVYTASVNPNLSPATDPLDLSGASFSVWCITNGTVKGVISASLTNETYYVLGKNIEHAEAYLPLTDLTNVLFFAHEGHFNRPDFDVSVGGSGYRDCTHWWIYAEKYECRLPLNHFPEATRALFSLNYSTSHISCYLSPDGVDWMECPWEFYKSGIASVAIPSQFRGKPIRARVEGKPTQPGGPRTFFHAGGFGLATSNNVPPMVNPTLLMEAVSGGIALSWPPLATDFVLERAVELNSGEWTPVIDGTNGSVISDQGGRFFRLRRVH